MEYEKAEFSITLVAKVYYTLQNSDKISLKIAFVLLFIKTS